MADRDHNRSNNTGTGAKALDRDADPASDLAMLGDDDLATPSQSGSSGGDLAREIGQRDEDKSAFGGDPQPTAVRKGDKPGDGDEPSLPNRTGSGNDSSSKGPPPRRT